MPEKVAENGAKGDDIETLCCSDGDYEANEARSALIKANSHGEHKSECGTFIRLYSDRDGWFKASSAWCLRCLKKRRG